MISVSFILKYWHQVNLTFAVRLTLTFFVHIRIGIPNYQQILSWKNTSFHTTPRCMGFLVDSVACFCCAQWLLECAREICHELLPESPYIESLYGVSGTKKCVFFRFFFKRHFSISTGQIRGGRSFGGGFCMVEISRPKAIYGEIHSKVPCGAQALPHAQRVARSSSFWMELVM